MQSAFEEAYCGYAETKEAYCKEFENCHAAADSAYLSAKQAVEQKKKHLHEAFTLHKRLECIIASWPLTAASKSVCDSMVVDVSPLGVTYPAKPVAIACVHPITPVPNEKDWAAAEYSAQPWKALVEPMKSCITTPSPPVPMPGWGICARLTSNMRGTTVDSKNGVDGNTYLSSSWGARDLTDWTSVGNHCPDIANPTAVKFKVWRSGPPKNLEFETGAFALAENVFVKTSGLYSQTNDAGAVFKMDQVSDQTGSQIYGDQCQNMYTFPHGGPIRTTFCVTSGSAPYQAIVGGMNNDRYGNGNGACMCNVRTICGICNSDSVVEIYMKQ